MENVISKLNAVYRGDEDDEDSDYDPENSPSRYRKGGKGAGKRGSREGVKVVVVKAARKKGSGGGAGGSAGATAEGGGEKRKSLEIEIDALLSDGEGGPDGPPPSIDSLEPLAAHTVRQLSQFLKAYTLPCSGKKGTELYPLL